MSYVVKHFVKTDRVLLLFTKKKDCYHYNITMLNFLLIAVFYYFCVAKQFQSNDDFYRALSYNLFKHALALAEICHHASAMERCALAGVVPRKETFL